LSFIGTIIFRVIPANGREDDKCNNKIGKNREYFSIGSIKTVVTEIIDSGKQDNDSDGVDPEILHAHDYK